MHSEVFSNRSFINRFIIRIIITIIRATRRRVSSKWRETCRNSLVTGTLWTRTGDHHLGKVSIRIFYRTCRDYMVARHCGKASIEIFDLQTAGQGHGEQSLIFRGQIKVTVNNFRNNAFRWQMSKSTNIICTFFYFAKVRPVRTKVTETHRQRHTQKRTSP